jgi:hypothetical protein
MMLQALSGAWPAGAVPTHIDYRGGALRLTGLKPEALETLRQAFANHARYRLEVQAGQVVLQAKESP